MATAKTRGAQRKETRLKMGHCLKWLRNTDLPSFQGTETVGKVTPVVLRTLVSALGLSLCPGRDWETDVIPGIKPELVVWKASILSFVL